jgi:hypothetical protein
MLFAQNEFYDIVPDLNSCQEGKLKEVEKQKVLTKVNAIRAIHGLKPVTYNYSKDIDVQKSALITTANEMLSHQPPSDWKCYSQEGAVGSEKSNLHIRWYYGSSYKSTVDAILNWMIDMNVDVCGHRRWILDPFVKFIAFGRVDGPSTKNPQFGVTAASIYVIDDNKQNLSEWTDDFIAYPFHNYPSELIYNSQNNYWHFHFTAVFNKNNWWDNSNVSFSDAVLEIKDEDGHNMPFTNVTPNNSGYGVPNMLRFDLTNLQKDIRYNVSIKNVKYKSKTKDYSYWFKVSDYVTTIPDVPILISPENDATDQATELKLTWQQVPEAASYNLEVATDISFSHLFVTEKDITKTTFNISSLEKNTKYFWHISSTNDAGTSEWSDTFVFTTGSGNSIGIPKLLYPANNAISVPTNMRIEWGAVPDAESYHLQISDTEDFPAAGLPLDQSNIPGNFYTVSNNLLQENKQYWYRVRAYGLEGISEWSDVFTFWTWIYASTDKQTGEKRATLTPNPSNGKIKVVTDDNLMLNISVYSMNGRLLSVFNHVNANRKIDVTNLDSGTYIVVITINNNQYIRKLTIIK